MKSTNEKNGVKSRHANKPKHESINANGSSFLMINKLEARIDRAVKLGLNFSAGRQCGSESVSRSFLFVRRELPLKQSIVTGSFD